MNTYESILVRMGGYSHHTVKARPREEREPITKLGGAVMLAALVASGNWAIAGWAYSVGVSAPFRIAILIVAGMVGGMIVVVLDTAFLYFADTSIAKGRTSLLVYAALRVIITLLVSSITSQAVMPIIMSDELAAHSLAMIEKSEDERMSKLGGLYDMDARKSAVKVATDEVKRLEKAASTIPHDIQQKLVSARSCWSNYTTRKAGYMNSGNSERDARDNLRWKAIQCERESKDANAERDAYFKHTRMQLDAAVDFKTHTTTELFDANNIINKKTERASLIETDAIGPRSATVLWSLLRSDPGAFIKWLVFTSLLLVLETLPLTLKFQAGQSIIGYRIAVQKAEEILELDNRFTQSKQNAVFNAGVIEASKLGIADAIRDPKVRATFADVFVAYIAAYAPTQAVQAMMSEFSARQYDVDQFMHRFPDYASIIAQAWSRAIRETTEILSAGIRGGAIRGASQQT